MTWSVIYSILNIHAGENVLYQVRVVKMHRLCIKSHETPMKFFRCSADPQPYGAWFVMEVSYDCTDTLGFGCSSTSRFNGTYGAAPPQGLVGPLLQCHILAPRAPRLSQLLGIMGSAVPPLGSVGPIVYSCLCVQWVLWCSSDSGSLRPVVQLHLWDQWALANLKCRVRFSMKNDPNFSLFSTHS